MTSHLDGPILVTGANGFIGSHLVETLVNRGYQVRCMVRTTSDLAFIRNLPVAWARADLADPDALYQACLGVRAVCHCAALTRALDEETFMQVNAKGTEALAQACLRTGTDLSRFLYVSSLAAVGPARNAHDFVDESREAKPITWYGRSKLAAEEGLHACSDRLPITIVRPAAVFGPRDRDFLAYFRLVRHGISLQVGRGDRWLSLIYVQDLVDLLVRALESDVAIGHTYFGCGPARTRVEFATAIARALGRNPIRISVPEVTLSLVAVYADIQGRLTGRSALLNRQRVLDMRQRYWLCSGEKAERELGFQAHKDLDTAAVETATWYRENGWL